MSDRFIKFIPSPEAMYLLLKKGHAFRLLTIIAEQARRYEGDLDGLKIGETFIGGFENYDMSEQNYRTAKEILVRRQHLEIVETCRTRKKVTTGVTTVGTKVRLLSSNVWDINLEYGNDRSNDRPTTDQRPTNDIQEGLRKNKNDKEYHHPYPSSNPDQMIDDDLSSKIEIYKGIFLNKELYDQCLKIKGSDEKLRQAVKSIQENPSRNKEIKNWINALQRWKIPNETLNKIQENENYAKDLCHRFTFENKFQWECQITTDTKKDQRGLSFISYSGYIQPIFISFSEGEFQGKCFKFMKEKKMIT